MPPVEPYSESNGHAQGLSHSDLDGIQMGVSTPLYIDPATSNVELMPGRDLAVSFQAPSTHASVSVDPPESYYRMQQSVLLERASGFEAFS